MLFTWVKRNLSKAKQPFFARNLKPALIWIDL